MAMMTSVNPYSGETIAVYEPLEPAGILERIDRAAGRWKDWKEFAFSERAALLQALALAMESDKKHLALLATVEMGKPITEAIAEVEKCVWLCQYFAEHAEQWLENEMVVTEARTFVSYEPLGVILGVMPWNYPYWQVLRFAVPAILAGNTVLVKHASNVQGCAQALEEIFARSAFPEGVYTHLAIGSKAVEGVIAHPDLKAVSLTGSEQAGMAVASVAGKYIKKCVLELGGSNAFIVLDDADLGKTVALAAKARLQNNGQSCIAAKRFILQEGIASEFTERLERIFRSTLSGNPELPETQMGPLARIDLAEALHLQVQRSVQKGAKIRCGGKRKDALYEPTILDNVYPGMAAFDEETFGPVAALCTARSEEEAVALANATRYGLGATICTKNIEKAEKIARQLKDGAVFVNEMVKSDPRLPFGGTGLSGYGRELGRHGIREFMNIKTNFFLT